MALYLPNWILPARTLLVLVLVAFLLGCAPAGIPSTSAPAGPESTFALNPPSPQEPGGDPTGTPPTAISQVLPRNSGTEVARPAAPDATGTALAISRAARRVKQTLAAESTATQAVEQALRDQAATSTAGAPPPAPNPTISLPPTPTPVSLLARFFEPLASFEGVLPGLLTDLRVSPEGILWVINENGVASLKGSAWTVYFPDVILWLAGFDGAGRTWMVNDQGTAALSWNGSEWRIYGEREGWLPIRTQRLLLLGEEMVTDRSGRVWMTTYQDVRSFDGREWTVYSLREIGFEPFAETAEYDGFSFPALEQDLQGNLWIGNCDSRGEEIAGQGARWFDGITWQGDAEPTSSGCVQDIAVDADGRVWLGIDDLLWRFDPKTKAWTRFDLPEPPDDMRIGWIEDIRFGPNGNPWIALALCGGSSCGSTYLRYRLQQDRWIQVPQPGENGLYKLYFDPEGNAWIFFGERLVLVEGSTLEPVPGVEICAIAQDSRGWLYLAAKHDRMKQIFVERGGR